jgi:hypothetical protein
MIDFPHPIDNGDDRKERDTRGRFLPGNKGGPGNLYAQKVQKLKAAMLAAVTAGDVRAVIKAVLEKAKGGDLAAAELLFDRLLGRPSPCDLENQLSRLEETVALLAQELTS